MDNYLQETYYFDYNHSEIQSMIVDYRGKRVTPDMISDLHIKIRDGWKYDPYQIRLKKDAFKASAIASRSAGHCIDKAILLVACMRGIGIPARIRLARVANHIAVEKLTQKMGTNELAPHGIGEIYFQDRWVKVSNAFNLSLCEVFSVKPLDFNGTQDAVFQEYNARDQKFMEYLEDYGSFEDVPMDFILATFQKHYPTLAQSFEGKDEFYIQ